MMQEAVFQEEIWGSIKSNILYTPLADMVTFGLYSKISGGVGIPTKESMTSNEYQGQQ